MPTPVRLRLFSDLACAGGVYIEDIGPRVVTGGEVVLALDDSEAGIEFSVLPDALCVPKLLRMRVVRATLHNGDVHEFRIRSVRKGRGSAGEEVFVRGQPAIYDLGAVGPIVEVPTGGTPRLSIGASLLTPDQWIDNFVLPGLEYYGIDWVAKGTIEATAPIGPIALDAWSPLQLLRYLAANATPPHELRLRRNGDTGYLIDLLAEIGSEHDPVLVEIGRNADGMEDLDDLGDTITVAIPRGITAPGAVEPATIAEVVAEVSAVDGTGPYTLTIFDPAGGPDFILDDGQLDGLYIENVFGARTEILDSSAPNQLSVADDLDLLGAAGSQIVFREDANGTRIIEMRHPTRSLPVQSGGLGRIVGDIPVPDARGERNYAPNPFFTDGGTGDLAIYEATVALGSSGTTLNLSGLPAGLDLTGAGAQQLPSVWTLSGKRDVVTGAVVSGGGTVTLTMENSAAESFGGVAFVIVTPTEAPDGWAPFGHVLYHVRDRDAQGTLTALVDGVHTSTRTLNLRSVTPGEKVQWGDAIRYNLGVGDVYNAIVSIEETVDGSGDVTVELANAVTLPTSTAVTILRPTFTDDGADDPDVHRAITFSQHGVTPGTSPGDEGFFALPPAIRPDTTSTVWVIASVVLTNWGIATILDPASTRRPPSLQVIDVDSGDVIREMWAFDDEPDDRSFAAGEIREFTMRLELSLDAETNVLVRFAPVAENNPALRGLRVVTHLKWVMIAATNDPDVPPIHGSHANALWHAGNRALRRLGTGDGPREVSLRDLSVARGLTQDTLHLGARVWRRDTQLGVDERPRMRVIRHAIGDQVDVRATLDDTAETASAVLARAVGAQGAAGIATTTSGGINNVTITGLTSTINEWLDRGGGMFNVAAFGSGQVALAAADTAATARGGGILVLPAGFEIEPTSALTVANPLLPAGGIIRPASAITVTVEKVIDPGAIQWIDTSDGGKVALRKFARLEWWGKGTSGSHLTADQTATYNALRAAYEAFGGLGGVVEYEGTVVVGVRDANGFVVFIGSDGAHVTLQPRDDNAKFMLADGIVDGSGIDLSVFRTNGNVPGLKWPRFKWDGNGTNNLLPSGTGSTEPNLLLEVFDLPEGDDAYIDCEAENHSGARIVGIGSSTTRPKRPVVRVRAHNMADAVTGNVHSHDHTTVWMRSDGGDADVHVTCDTMAATATALEQHGVRERGRVNGKRIRYAYLPAALFGDSLDCVASIVCEEVQCAVAPYVSGSNRLRHRIESITGTQQNEAFAYVDDVNVTGGLPGGSELSFGYLGVENVSPTATGDAAAAIRGGKFPGKMHFQSVSAKNMPCGVLNSANPVVSDATEIVIDQYIAEDCCRTSHAGAGLQYPIRLLTGNKIKALHLGRGKLRNTGGAATPMAGWLYLDAHFGDLDTGSIDPGTVPPTMSTGSNYMVDRASARNLSLQGNLGTGGEYDIDLSPRAGMLRVVVRGPTIQLGVIFGFSDPSTTPQVIAVPAAQAGDVATSDSLGDLCLFWNAGKLRLKNNLSETVDFTAVVDWT